MNVERHIVSKMPEIEFSPAAIKHIVAYLEQHAEHQGVRLSVKKKGCSGYAYMVDYVKAQTAEDVMMSLNEKYMVFIDKQSLPYIQGMHVDYVKQGLNYKFIFKNPNQTGQCGCGESFTVD